MGGMSSRDEEGVHSGAHKLPPPLTGSEIGSLLFLNLKPLLIFVLTQITFDSHLKHINVDVLLIPSIQGCSHDF